MSEDSVRAVSVDEDGIAVRKSFVTDEFQVPAVSFRLHSQRDEPVIVRLTDTIPESFPMERIGFHPDHGSEDWTAYDDSRVEFEREIAPDEEIRTVYGIRADDPDPEAFLSTPAIGTAADSAELEAVIGEDDGAAVREVLSGDRESLPGMSEADEATAAPGGEADAGGDAEADPEGATADAGAPEPRSLAADTEPAVTETDDEGRSLDLSPDDGSEAAGGPDLGGSEPVGEEAEADAEPDLDLELSDSDLDDAEAGAADEAAAAGPIGDLAGGPDEADDTASPVDQKSPAARGFAGDGLAAALASELRAGEVADEDVETLREAVSATDTGDGDTREDGDAELPESVEVRIDHLGSRVEEVAAYADALEAFIDENGTAKELLDDLDEEVTALRGELRDLEARADSAADEREEIADDVERALGDVNHLEERTTDVEATVDDLESGLSAARQRIDDLDTAVETVTDEAAALDERLDATDEDVRDVEHRVGAVETELSESVEDLEAELSDVRDHLAELDEFRERLNDVFGD